MRISDWSSDVCSSDLMEERARDALVYLDRSNDVLKLSQGEFVAIGTLGSTFETGCPAIQQMYVYGNSARSFRLAVIVPDKKVFETRLGENPAEIGRASGREREGKYVEYSGVAVTIK